MSRYEDLTEKQKALYNKLEDAIENEKNITPILEEIKKEAVLKEVLTTANITKKLSNGTKCTLTPLAYAMDFNNFEKRIKVILDVAEKNSILKEVFVGIEEHDHERLKNILETLKNQEKDEEQKTKIDGWLALAHESSIPKAEENIANNEGMKDTFEIESNTSKIENSDKYPQKDTVKTINRSIMIGIVFSKMNDKFPLWYYQPKVVNLYIYTLEV